MNIPVKRTGTKMIKSNSIKRFDAITALVATLAIYTCLRVEARPSSEQTYPIESVIQSPNADLSLASTAFESQRNSAVAPTGGPTSAATTFTRRSMASLEPMQESRLVESSSNEVPAQTPVYASPYLRAADITASAGYPLRFESSQESSQAPPNYAPRPTLANQQVSSSDLKTSASYGHHHHGGHHHGYGPSGWLDMGAWTGHKGSFGWYADYPVGGKHHYGYGRK